MEFENVKEKHIIQAIEDFKEKGYPNDFGPSSTYDLVYEGEKYPPKAIMAYANYHAEGRKIERYFKGGLDTDCFKAFDRNGFNIIPKMKQMDIQNVKLEFAKWLNLNTFDSYRSYLGATIQDIVIRLDEIDSFFNDLELFEVNPFEIEKLKITLSKKLRKKERIKNTEFVEYDLKHSNGIPKAIIGKNNYFKFLDEKFNTNVSKINYWIFQGNPKIYDVATALNDDAVKTWNVKAHKDKIKPGDKVIIWVTGQESGCYALAEVASEVFHGSEDEIEIKYYTEESKKHYSDAEKKAKTNRVRLKIIRNLLENPILWEDIKELDEFKEFKGGNQGTNFSATAIEYNTLKELIFSNNRASYFKVKEILDPEKLNEFLEVIRIFIKEHSIDPYDNRISFNVRENRKRLAFIIGSRYALSIEKKQQKTTLSFISKDILSNQSGAFNNHKGEIEAYWNIVDSFDGFEKKINVGLQIELNRNNKSPFRKWTNQDFINDVFQIETIMDTKNKESIGALNTILYGPPGTGKTYSLQKAYFDEFTIKESSITREQYLENVVADLTWWQVLSIALLDIGTPNVGEIFNHEFIQIKAKLSNSKSIRPTLWGTLQSHTTMDCPNVNVSHRSEPLLFYKRKNSTWTVDKQLLKENYPEAFELLATSKNFVRNDVEEIKNYEFVTFHQSFGYEDFVEGIKPKMETENDELSYEIKDGVFKKLCQKAKADLSQNYAIFIDEINRGNVSAIFGELITLIEEDKRLGAENEIRVTLPYSKESFGVPPNLYIFGTMNTADRSVEALDTALRRRFTFQEVMPKPEILEKITFNGFNVKEVLETINNRIEILLDRDHTIGHSYFIKLKSGESEGLKRVFENSIIPLLQEYFYHDYAKIALILGNGFIKEKKTKVEFAKFENLDEPDIENSYNLINNIEDIEEAMMTLLNKNV